ncbi:MAG: adenine phosphoribosyltransferase [Candidatus Sumerlaeia bacterium]
MDLHAYIRDIPDFPKPGIIFKDIAPLLGNAEAFRYTVDLLADRYSDKKIDKIAGIESRGFIFGGALAVRLGCGFIPVRKPGKLPWETISQSYELEYGTNTLEIHKDALEKGEKILILDDLLATGGTVEATAQIIEKLGGDVVEIVTLIELAFLKGREKIAKYPFYVFMQF